MTEMPKPPPRTGPQLNLMSTLWRLWGWYGALERACLWRQLEPGPNLVATCSCDPL